jgi:hypothetical protein
VATTSKIRDAFTMRITASSLVASLLIFSIAFISIIRPLFQSSHDMWDGASIAYGTTINDLTGIHNWFYESALYGQFWEIFALQSISSSFGIKYLLVSNVFISVIFLLLLHECFLLAKNYLLLPKFWSVIVVLLIASSPLWQLLMSSVLSFYLMCITVAMVGVRLSHNQNSILRLVGLLLLIISFYYKAILVFGPVLSYLYDTSKNPKHAKIVFPSVTTLKIFFCGVAFFVILKLFFPQTGQYLFYNSIPLMFAIKSFSVAILQFSTFLILPSLILFISVVGSFLFLPSRLNISKLGRTDNFKRVLIALILLLIASALPFAVVDRHAHFWQIFSWSGRHGFVVIVALGLFVGYLLYCVTEMFQIKETHARIVGGVSAAILIIIHLVGSSMGVEQKLSRQAFERDLILKLVPHKDKLLPGRLQIVGTGIPSPGFGTYDSNYLAYRAFGQSLWYTRIADTKMDNFNIPDFLKFPPYQIKQIYTPSNLNCSNIFKIAAHGYQREKGYIEQFKVLFDSAPKRGLTLLSSDFSCKK